VVAFGIDDTHGILKRPGNEFVAVSERQPRLAFRAGTPEPAHVTSLPI
jgi:hypothetical protein